MPRWEVAPVLPLVSPVLLFEGPVWCGSALGWEAAFPFTSAALKY